MKHFYSKAIPVFLLLFLPSYVNVWANISKSLRDSLLYESSGNYLWSVWDYQTSPYLYSLNQRDNVSLLVTGNKFFTLGTSLFTSYYVPVFLGIELKNGTSQGRKYNEEPPAANIAHLESKQDNRDINVILGTLPFKYIDFLRNTGLGIYFRQKRNTQELSPVTFNTGSTGRRKGESNLSNDRGDRSLTSFGIEFGHVSGEEANSSDFGGFSYSFSLGYNDYGVDIEEIKDNGDLAGLNDAPFLELAASTSGFTKIFNVKTYFGPKKKEWAAHFLSWYAMTPASNAGLAFDIFIQPELKGTNRSTLTTSTLGEAKLSQIGVTSFKYVFELFFDIDSPLIIENSKIGVFRVTPSLRALYHTEETKFDEILGNGTVKSQEQYYRLGVAFKFYVFLDKGKSFRLVLGWLPHFNLQHTTTQEISGFTNLSTFNPQTDDKYTYEQNIDFLADEGSFIETPRLGFEYSPYEELSLYTGFLPDSAGRFNLSSINIAMDYSF